MSVYITEKERQAITRHVECDDVLDAFQKAMELAERLIEARVEVHAITKLMHGEARVSWDENGNEAWEFRKEDLA